MLMLMMPSKILLCTITTFVLSSVISFINAQNSSLSELCTSQSEVLEANTALVAAAPRLECNIEAGKDSCTVDFEPVSDNFKDACFEAGGKIYVVDLLLDCTANVNGGQYNADFTYLNAPSCVGLNCTAEDLDEVFAKSYPLVEQQLFEQGFTCDLSDRNEMTIEKSNAAGTLFSFSISGILGGFALIMVGLHV